MIYLIDDKKSRQASYGWSKDKLNEYSNIIKPIYSHKEIVVNRLNEEIFSNGSIILFHESFFDNSEAHSNDEAVRIRKKMLGIAEDKADISVAVFSGSKKSRIKENNVVHLPASIVYQNLQVFADKVNDNISDFRYLLFGENFNVEELLQTNLNIADKNIDPLPEYITESENLFIRPNKNFIQNPLQKFDEKTLFNKVSDLDLSTKIIDWLSTKEYDNIFIPICFGATLSDFNGLRLATHIRCSGTVNHLKNIYIYSFIDDYSLLVNNEYFDILKTKNVSLIAHKRSAFKNVIEQPSVQLSNSQLSSEIRKVKLNPPNNYEDSHSIANEWAIFRWASVLNIEDNDIQKIFNKVNSQLYFKYLTTIYPSSELSIIPKSQLKISYTESPKVLYVDDEADKGWCELLDTILFSINKLYFDYLDQEFNSKTQDEIIEIVKNKIIEEDFDVIILDFRLHNQDFNTKNIEEVTGLRLLKEIKAINPGIQVIIFSATNKVWNMDALLKAGADGFVLKESIENSVDSNFTNETITNFLKTIETSLERKFLKQLFNNCATIKNQLLNTDSVDDTPFEEFVNDLIKHVKLISSSINNIELHDTMSLDIVFLNCYNFLEKFKNHYLKRTNNQYVLGIEETEMNRYYVEKPRKAVNEGLFIPNNYYDKPSWFNCLSGLFIDYFEIASLEENDITLINQVKDNRNDYIHGKKKKFNKNELLMILNLCIRITSRIKE